jgi:thiamine pyrophosphokinase
MLYSTQNKLMIVGGADFSEDLFQYVYDAEIPIVAADGGANFLADHNIIPELIIGDLDSVEEQKIKNVETQKIIRISNQNTTDLEKVLLNTQSPLTLGIGFLGSRIDHELAALSALVKFSHKKIILIGEKDIVLLSPPSFSLSFRLSQSPIQRFKMVNRGINHETNSSNWNLK